MIRRTGAPVYVDGQQGTPRRCAAAASGMARSRSKPAHGRHQVTQGGQVLCLVSASCFDLSSFTLSALPSAVLGWVSGTGIAAYTRLSPSNQRLRLVGVLATLYCRARGAIPRHVGAYFARGCIGRAVRVRRHHVWHELGTGRAGGGDHRRGDGGSRPPRTAPAAHDGRR